MRFAKTRTGGSAVAALVALLALAGEAGGAEKAPLGALKPLPTSGGCIKDPTAASNYTTCRTVGNGLKGAITAVVSPDGRNVYVASFIGDAIAAFKRDQQTGQLTQLPGAAGCIKAVKGDGPARCTSSARGIDGVIGLAISPDGKSVYGVGNDSSAIAIFKRDSKSGALSQLPGAAGCVQEKFPATARAVCQTRAQGLHGVRWATVSPDGKNVYTAAPSGHSIAAFSRDPKTGALTQLPGAAACIEDPGDNSPNSGLPNGSLKSNCQVTAKGLAYPRMITVSPDGRNAYTADSFGSAVAEFSRDPGTGALAPLGGADGCIKDTLNAPSYTHCPSSAPSLNGAFSVAVSPDGANAYVGSDAGDAITAFSRDAATGALRRLPGPAACVREYNAPVSTLCDVKGNGLSGAEMVTVSPDGHSVYAAAFHGMAVAAFSRDETSGALTQLPGANGCIEDLRARISTRTRCKSRTDGLYEPRQVAISPDGRFAYVPSSVGDTLAVLARSGNGAVVPFKHRIAAGGGAWGTATAIGIVFVAVLLLAAGVLLARRQKRRPGKRRRSYYGF